MISNSDRFGGDSYLFGDGSDGTVVISSNTTLSAGEIKQYENLTINSGYYLNGAVNEILTIRVNGTLTVNGLLGQGSRGSAGSTTNGVNGLFTTDMSFVSTSSGGVGTTYTGGDGIGAGGGAGTPGGTQNGGATQPNAMYFLNALPRIITTTKDVFSGGGGAGRVSPARLGGNGGGHAHIFAKNIVIGAAGSITCSGSDGVNPDTTGGGGGGFLALVYSSLTNAGSNNIHCNGGNGKYSGGTTAAGGTAYLNQSPTAGTNIALAFAGGGGGGGICVGLKI